MNFLLVFVGFSLIVIFHELGHFLAARWAGIRVLAFAVGFGPAVFSWRGDRGFGWGGAPAEGGERVPTEYRWNLLPFGGYVKMLGQEDLDPTAVSDAPDSYQNCPPWKRMVVISAGVVMNLIVGALLFMTVFLVGLRTEPPWIGSVEPGSPAAEAVPLNAREAGVTLPGLRGGDRVLEVDGEVPRTFNDLVMASMMSKRDQRILVTVRREGIDLPLQFEVVPQLNVLTRFREIGVRPERSLRLPETHGPVERENFDRFAEWLGWQGVRPGMKLVRVGDEVDPASPAALNRAASAARGEPFEAEFRDDQGSVVVTIESRPEFQTDLVPAADDRYMEIDHLLGLTPVMAVREVEERGASQGLQPGDVLVRVGDLDYPGLGAGQREIQRHAGKPIALAALRRGADGTWQRNDWQASVSDEGRLGFSLEEIGSAGTWLVEPPVQLRSVYGKEAVHTPAARRVVREAGTRVVAVDGLPVATFAGLRLALRDATAGALTTDAPQATVSLTLLGPEPGAEPRAVPWRLEADEIRSLHALGWTTRGALALFPPEQFDLRADGPLGAMKMGVLETHDWILRTYVTFARLFHGTVKIEHLKGPIGIAHLGTVVADRGLIWLMFFMGLISVNLAVINFLPLPIVDGGQFLFLVVEQVRGRPVPAGLQNAITVAGLVLLVSLFLFITYNDIVGLFTGT